jgi:hypothetical protein
MNVSLALQIAKSGLLRAAFLISWALMTFLPSAVALANMKKIGQPVPLSQADPALYWKIYGAFVIGWLVATVFLSTAVAKVARLCRRIERLEAELQRQTRGPGS